MTRIGFAYNQKPDAIAGFSSVQLDGPRPEDEPPSNRRDIMSRNPQAPASEITDARGSTDAAILDVADRYAEWDSQQTIDAVANALGAYGEVIPLEATADFPGRLRQESPDIVFNIAEGLSGMNREAHVPAICEFFEIPFSASDPFTLSLCLNKARTKEVLAYHGVPTAAFTLISTVADLDRLLGGDLGALPSPSRHPLFVKPVQEGSSKGITERNLVRSSDELEAQVLSLLEGYAQPVLVEEFLPGREFTCGILGNGDAARVLPIVGLNFSALPDGALPIYGFEAKWIWDQPENPLEMFQCPARMDKPLRRAIESVTLRAYRALGCRDWARVDVRLDARGLPNVVEVNPLPGILPDPADNSCLPKAARAAGISYDELIQTCLRHAADRNRVPLARMGS